MPRLSPQAWLHPFIGKVLNVHPYFWFHYLFESVYLNNAKARQLWDNTPKISADIPHALQSVGLFNPLTNTIKDNIDNQTAPCYKLVWNYPPENLKAETVLDYLLNESLL
nr:capsular polysaccharide synthesis protein [Mucilaginibacter sp. SP1R1]